MIQLTCLSPNPSTPGTENIWNGPIWRSSKGPTISTARELPANCSSACAMPNNAALSEGKEQLTASFEFLLETFRINISYTIEEIIVNGDHAFVRTSSKVATHVKATGEDIFLKNKELFVLRNQQRDWKISHHIFNNTFVSK
jgi:ketosteroid isomerase-like protein